jgi:HSP20 family protein
MAIVRWDPFRELTALQGEVNRMLRRFGGDGGEVSRESWMPSLDVIETKDAIELKADLAGLKPEDIQLEVEENVLTLRGERRFEERVEEDKYYRIERRYGSFQRSIGLPQNVSTDSIHANYENGVLHVTVPKIEEAKPKKISVGVTKGEPRTVEATSSEKPQK